MARKVRAETIREKKIIIEKEERIRIIQKEDVILQPSVAGFKRKKGTYDNLWDWKTLEDIKIK